MKDVPADYYARLAEVDARHWWARGMIEIEAALLAPWLSDGRLRLLDAGCGTGGFLAWADRSGRFAELSGVDLSPEALDVCRARVPSAELATAPLSALPFADGAFDVVVSNDVLQHVEEQEVTASLGELGRVLANGGALAVRTNGARRGRRERADWRLYDETALRAELERAGFRVRRTTYANLLFSALAEVRGSGPQAPTSRSCGIPSRPGGVASALGGTALGVEASVVRRGGRVPWGHTLLAVAIRE
ncbi:MAG TPA: class I SAM-dependent methyltransferase [Gaiellaceae bacterium]|nr:class I SAM-dependent methyltransferase [Gaiellaceae bacterium]